MDRVIFDDLGHPRVRCDERCALRDTASVSYRCHERKKNIFGLDKDVFVFENRYSLLRVHSLRYIFFLSQFLPLSLLASSLINLTAGIISVFRTRYPDLSFRCLHNIRPKHQDRYPPYCIFDQPAARRLGGARALSQSDIHRQALHPNQPLTASHSQHRSNHDPPDLTPNGTPINPRITSHQPQIESPREKKRKEKKKDGMRRVVEPISTDQISQSHRPLNHPHLVT